ncbi:MAG: metallophosphoesterase [Clostridiaceae bacterium]|jgi:predicted phosphohydrolase|nr:metallophosphoesterase [Clostridiaceae bacterium]
MKIFVISDLHLSGAVSKPMDIFGEQWIDYWERICDDWRARVAEEDLVLLGGDLSWGMTSEEAAPDLAEIGALPGKKVIIRGNHDYWWSSYNKVKKILPQGMFAIQNNAVRIGGAVIAGTRGWTVADEDSEAEDKKIYLREQQRLRLSLEDLKQKNTDGAYEVLMLHFPPFNAQFGESEFTKIIEEYGIKNVIYGHLHGKRCRGELEVVKNGVKYYLTSCDQLHNELLCLRQD